MFEMILFGLVCLCGLIMLFCKFVVPNLAKRNPEPLYLDYARSFFPVLLLVFLLRGFIAEPFRIPSGSMLPTLEIGDFILVNKFSYGIRLPILHQKILSVDEPKRGDIVVFRHPPKNKVSFIKRLIGLPGDEIEFRGRNIFVNGQQVSTVPDSDYIPFGETKALSRFNQFIKTEGTGDIGSDDSEMVEYSILFSPYSLGNSKRGRVKVPAGHYFMMGDNRDNSSDSRAWGFVPDENIIGRAFFVWFHYNPKPNGGIKLSRIGTEIQAQPAAEPHTSKG